MTKKDYELISDAINSVVSRESSDEATVHAIVDVLAVALRYDDSRFDAFRFKRACLR